MKCSLLAAVLAACSAQAVAQQQPAQPPYVSSLPRHLVAAGNINDAPGDEVVVWDGGLRELVVFGSKADEELERLDAYVPEGHPSALAVADVDEDGVDEVLLGEAVPDADAAGTGRARVRLSLFRPTGSAWRRETVFETASTRPDLAHIQVRARAIYFRYYESRYITVIAAARRTTHGWRTEKLASLHMGSSLAVGPAGDDGQVDVVIGRPYAEPLDDPAGGEGRTLIREGDAFILRGAEKERLPVRRGVSSLALASGGAREIFVGDGWHYDYNIIARARLAVISRRADGWDYELIEDLPGFNRVVKIAPADFDGDGREEVFALFQQGGRQALRIYRRTASGWRGATVAENVKDFAFVRAHAHGEYGRLVYAAPRLRTMALDMAQIDWDASLHEALETWKNNPASLVGTIAPDLTAAEWIGSDPMSLRDLRGRVVLLDFWATWCVPCIRTFPALQKLLADHRDEGLVIVGVTNHLRQSPGAIQKFLDQHPLPWPVAVDPDSRPHMAFGVGPIPHQVLIDRNGVVRAWFVGAGHEKRIERQVRELLAEPRGR